MSPGSENARGQQMVMVEEVQAGKYIAALDVGTTTIRCHIFDQNAQIKGTATDQVIFMWFLTGIFSNGGIFMEIFFLL